MPKNIVTCSKGSKIKFKNARKKESFRAENNKTSIIDKKDSYQEEQINGKSIDME